MALKTNRYKESSPLDTVVLLFDADDIKSGRLITFFQNMLKVSNFQYKPLLYIICAAIHHTKPLQAEILRLMSEKKLKSQFKRIIFKQASSLNGFYVQKTQYKDFAGKSSLFFWAMSTIINYNYYIIINF
jgi:hypothetical protein